MMSSFSHSPTLVSHQDSLLCFHLPLPSSPFHHPIFSSYTPHIFLLWASPLHVLCSGNALIGLKQVAPRKTQISGGGGGCVVVLYEGQIKMRKSLLCVSLIG